MGKPTSDEMKKMEVYRALTQLCVLLISLSSCRPSRSSRMHILSSTSRMPRSHDHDVELGEETQTLYNITRKCYWISAVLNIAISVLQLRQGSREASGPPRHDSDPVCTAKMLHFERVEREVGCVNTPSMHVSTVRRDEQSRRFWTLGLCYVCSA